MSYKPIQPNTFVSETQDELHTRTAKFIQGLVARLDSESPETEAVLLVTHAATKIALGRALLQDPTCDIRTGTCSLDTFTRKPGSDRWEAVSIGETGFLSKGEEMHWGFGFEAKPEITDSTLTATAAAAATGGMKRKQTLAEKLAIITKRRLEEEKAKQAAVAEREANNNKNNDDDEEFDDVDEDYDEDENNEEDEEGDVDMKDSESAF